MTTEVARRRPAEPEVIARRDLPAIATEIRRELERAEQLWQSAVETAIRAGELLIEAKSRLKHGEWLSWLEANFPKTRRTAENYMRLAGDAEKAKSLSHLGVAGALRELANPTVLAVPRRAQAEAGRAARLGTPGFATARARQDPRRPRGPRPRAGGERRHPRRGRASSRPREQRRGGLAAPARRERSDRARAGPEGHRVRREAARGLSPGFEEHAALTRALGVLRELGDPDRGGRLG